MKKNIRKIILGLGADICGIANVSRFSDVGREYQLGTIWDNCKSVIVFGIALPESFYDIQSRLIYTHFIAMATQKVDEISFTAAREIEKTEKIKALQIPGDNPCEYWNADRLTSGALLIDSSLESDELSEELCIPNCHLCLDNCPAGAISNKTVNQKKCRLNTYKTTERGFDTI